MGAPYRLASGARTDIFYDYGDASGCRYDPVPLVPAG